MASIYGKRMTPSKRVKHQEKAYEKILNLQPAQEQRHSQEMGRVRDRLTDDIAETAKQGGYQGRKQSGEALGQSALEVSQLASQQEAEEDALTFQGAGLKESIIGQRQGAASADFVRKRDKEMKALAEAVTQRAFDLGMSSKELAFHNNALVSDAGFKALERDFQQGRVDRRELLQLMYRQQLQAQQAKQAAERMISEVQGEMQYALKQSDIEAAKERFKLALKLQKKAAEDTAKSSSIAAIISGITTIGGGAVGAIFGGPAGAAVGSQLGNSMGGIASVAVS